MNTYVFMEKRVIQKINELVHSNPNKECGGFFIGNISRDEITDRYCVHVHDLYFEKLEGTSSTFEFSLDYTMRAFKHVRKNCKGYHIIGNVHSHAQYQAFFSPTDKNMMAQAKNNSFYMVVSPGDSSWVCTFKDTNFNYHECDLMIAATPNPDSLFNKSIESCTDERILNGKKCKSTTFRTSRFYSETQQAEFDKRFLHSIKKLDGKKVLIIGAGTIGNFLAEYAMNSGISDLCIVDMDLYQYWNLPRSSLITEESLGKPKALELAAAVAERSSFPIKVTGINADICDLGWGFLKDFDLVLSPVDSNAVRQYIDRGCKLYKIPHITCGTGTLDDGFTGNVVTFPADSPVDLEYIWGTAYRKKLIERMGCSDIKQETQAQVMSFSSQIAGMTMDLALGYLLGTIKEEVPTKYVLNGLGNGFARDKAALRAFRYSVHPEADDSELFSIFSPSTEIPRISFNRDRPKHELWEKLEEMFREDISSYRLNLEWALNIPVVYRSIDSYPRIQVARDSGVDPILKSLPPTHIYLVEGDKNDYLIELTLTDDEQ